MRRVLQPDFRDRLIESLERVGVPLKARQAYVSSLTSRAPQTVSRWLDPDRPGLPDLESCARLCEGLGRSSDWLLGLTSRLSLDRSEAAAASSTEIDWAWDVLREMRGESSGVKVMRMRGDEMSPTIRDGDLLFVAHGADRILGNGIYALELDGRTVVRRVEAGLGTGLIIKCDNTGYRTQDLKDAAAVKRVGLRVTGKVQGAIGATRFWHQ